VIEVAMVKRMFLRALVLAPVVIGALAVAGGGKWALSAAIGLAMTLGNLWLSARIIGGVAEKDPKLLLAAAMVAFTLGLAVLVALGFALEAAKIVYFPVTGFVLIGSHMVLVLWEAAGAFPVKNADGAMRAQG
jgi:hypothetical protein